MSVSSLNIMNKKCTSLFVGGSNEGQLQGVYNGTCNSIRRTGFVGFGHDLSHIVHVLGSLGSEHPVNFDVCS